MKPSQSKTLIDKEDIRIIQAKLAAEIGVNENIFLQQIHYWLKGNEERNHNYKDGRYWTYNSYSKWKEKSFPFWSKSTIKRTVKSLEKQNLIITTSKYNKENYDQTKWYTINYEKLKKIEEDAYNIKDHGSDTGGGQNEQGGTGQNGTTPDQDEQTNTKDFSKTSSSKINNNKVAKLKKLFQEIYTRPLNKLQLKKINSSFDKLTFDLVYKFLEDCGLSGHTQGYFIRGLDLLMDNGVYTISDYNKTKSKSSSKTKAQNNSNNNNKQDNNYKWRDFFIDPDKYKE